MLSKFEKALRSVSVYGLIVVGCFIAGSADVSAAGPTYVAQHITASTTWTLENSPYIVPYNFVVQVFAPLTIEPGVVIKMMSGYWVGQTSGMAVYGPVGKISAEGRNDAPIVFTSIWDHEYAPEIGTELNPAKGDWASMNFNNDDSVLSNVIIRYAGYRPRSNASVEFNNGSRARMVDSVIEQSDVMGIIVTNDASPLLDWMVIRNNNGIAFKAGTMAGPGMLRNSNIYGHDGPVLFEIDANSLFRFENNTYNNLDSRYINWTGSASRVAVWRNLGVPYMNVPDVEASGQVYVEAGTVFKVIPSYYSYYAKSYTTIFGTINAAGNEDNPIVITSWNDDSVGGDTNGDGNRTSPMPCDWHELAFLDSKGTSTLDHVEIRYAGKQYSVFRNASVYVENSDLSVRNSKIVDGCSAGIQTIYESNLSVFNSEISRHYYGISVEYGASGAEVHNSRIFDNINYGLQNYAGFQIDATNNWWGSDTGPTVSTNPAGTGDKISGNIFYDPWAGKIKERVPVIIVPGIISSYLNKNEPGLPEVWPNIPKMAWSDDDSYLYDLSMNQMGVPNELNIKPTDIFRSILGQDVSVGLIDELESAGYKENEDLFVFPYDWRLDVRWTAGDSPMPNTATLKDKIEDVLRSTGSEKVNIIAHSMGGLVTKAYMQIYGSEKIDSFIDIATPHFGAPKTFKMLMYGDDMGLSFFFTGANPITMKNISQNMPGVFGLLPSQAYQNISIFSAPDNNYSSYITDIDDIDENNVKGNLGYSDSYEFMKNTGLNRSLLDSAVSLHADIDGFDFDKTYNIVGCGVPTIGKIYILNKEKSGGYEYGLKYIDGDGTVPLKSADALSTSKRYYKKGVEHGILSSAEGVRQLAASILSGAQDKFNINNYENFKSDGSSCGINGTQISFHSPIDIHVYDTLGNHAGPDSNGEIENKIVGAAYDIIEGNKFIFLPINSQYRIEGQATSDGSFNARIQTIESDQYVEGAYFNEIPLKINTKIKIENTSSKEIEYDIDGDGQIDEILYPDSVLNATAMEDIDKPETEISLSGTNGNNGWFVTSVNIGLSAMDNAGGSGLLKTEYSLDDGQTWAAYSLPIYLDIDGIYKLIYASVDRAGNREVEKEITLRIDKTKPAVNVSSLEERYILNYPATPFYYNSQDNISGLKNLSTVLDNSPFKSGDFVNFNEPGYHRIIITAEDYAGNINIQSIDFQVIYSFSGFLPPIKVDGTGVYKLGRTIPIKFSLLDVLSQYVTGAIANLSAIFIEDNVFGTEVNLLPVSNADTGDLFRYDPVDNQYIYNLSTNMFLSGTWQLKVGMDDGANYQVNILLGR